MRVTPGEGQEIMYRGHKMIARNVRVSTDYFSGKTRVDFEGHMVHDSSNKGLLGSGYDGAVYGHYIGAFEYPDTD